MVNIQGFELRDASVNRDTTILNSSNVYVDVNQLEAIAASPAYPSTRLYTAGGLLEVSGEVGNVGHTIQEWSTLGGTVTLSGSTVTTQPGAIVNIAGGSVTYQGGNLKNSYLTGVDGNVYNVNTAPGDLQYSGVYSGFTTSQPRWNYSQTFNSFIFPSETYQSGFTVGRDAGSLVVNSQNPTLEGTIDGGAAATAVQTALRGASFSLAASTVSTPILNTPFLLQSLLAIPAPTGGTTVTTSTLASAAEVDDPFQLAQNVVPLGGELLVGPYTAAGLSTTATPMLSAIIGNGTLKATGVISADQLTASGLASVSVTAANSIVVQAPITLAPGGQVSLTAANVTISGSITARAGSVTVNNTLTAPSGTVSILTYANPKAPYAFTASITLDANTTIDTRGEFTNALIAPGDASGEALVNGGNVSLVSSGLVNLAPGSVIDTSSGAAITRTGSTIGGSGGNITLIADSVNAVGPATTTGYLALGGTLRGAGVTKGGVLTIQTPGIVIGTPLTRDFAKLFRHAV